MLEKAILVDQLNKKILHRPGPLELIEKNILHANEPIERIVKEGLVPFKVTGEDSVEKNFLSFEDDSQSSEGDLFHHTTQIQPEVTLAEFSTEALGQNLQEQNIFESLPTSSGVINISLVPTNSLLASTSTPISLATFKLHNPNVEAINIPPPPPPPKLELITYHVKPMLQAQVKGLINTQNFLPIQISETPMTNVNTVIAPSLLPTQTQSAVNQHVSSFIQNNQKFSAPGKEKNRKKCKNKAMSKARAIKFHEYKGPPNKGGSSSSSSSSSASLAANKKGETNYEFIMQQQCLLEYLEGIYKNPHAVSEKPESESQKFVNKPIKIEKAPEYLEEKPASIQEKSKTFNKPHVTIFPSKPSAQSPPSSSVETSKDVNITDVSKLSKMKVSELKAYLKRVNLPVSGPKPLLIERLKPYLPLKPLEDNHDDCSTMMSDGNDFYNSSLHSVSSAESDMDNMDCSKSLKDEDIVAEQQRKIEELQRKLQQSQQELEQMKQHKPADAPAQAIIFEPQYQMQNQISAVYVVDVAEQVEEPHSPAKIKTPMLHEPSTGSSMHETTSDVVIAPTSELILNQEKESSLLNDKIANASTSNIIPMSQDITDVLEILLKNGEWPELSEDGKCFIQNLSENSPLSNENALSAKHFITDVLSVHNPFDVMSPMNEDPILHADEAIDKILGELN